MAKEQPDLRELWGVPGLYFRFQPKGKALLGHTSEASDEMLPQGYVFAYEGQWPSLALEWFDYANRRHEAVYFTATGQYDPGDYEGVAVIPKQVVGRYSIKEWLTVGAEMDADNSAWYVKRLSRKYNPFEQPEPPDELYDPDIRSNPGLTLTPEDKLIVDVDAAKKHMEKIAAEEGWPASGPDSPWDRCSVVAEYSSNFLRLERGWNAMSVAGSTGHMFVLIPEDVEHPSPNDIIVDLWSAAYEARLEPKIFRAGDVADNPTYWYDMRTDVLEGKKAPWWDDPDIRSNPGEPFIRFEHKNGLGLMNNSGLERGKLSDDEEFELDELLGLGLRQPLGVASGALFAFTPEGVKAHARLIKLLRKASKTGVRKILLDPAAYRVVWQSGDGQVALVPA